MAEEKEMCPSCCGRKKHRQEAEYQDLLKRLNRIEGQVRGVKKMLEEDIRAGKEEAVDELCATLQKLMK